jgi:type II secretory pathway component PulF
MPTFEYKIIGSDGIPKTEVTEATSRDELATLLESDNNMILSIKEKKEGFSFEKLSESMEKITPEDLNVFTDQLMTLLKAGIPLVSSLESLVEQTEKKRFKRILRQIVDDINAGLSLSDALAKHPKVFNDLYVNMVAAGEQAGVLDDILERLGSFIEHDVTVRKNVKSAMRYPIIVMVALTIAFVLAITMVIPKFASLFKAQDMELPLPTRILIGLSDFMSSYYYVIIGTIIGLLIIFRRFISTKKGRLVWDRVKLKLPIFGKIIKKTALARFGHMLATLVQAGIQILEALTTVSKTVGNMAVAQEIKTYLRALEVAMTRRKMKLGNMKKFLQRIIRQPPSR